MQFIQNIRERLLGNVLYKFSLIFSSLYAVLFFANIRGSRILFYLFISILLSVGIAGLGYAMNDIKDYKDDVRNNKKNLFLNFTRFQSVCIVALFIFLAVFPWFYLPFNRTTIYYLLVEFSLFFLYALPPFRLKEKGFAGIITDALYAQTVPCLLAVYTYSRLGEKLHIPVQFLCCYAVWLLLAGIRNIIKHQIEDIENDKKTNTVTFVSRIGTVSAEKITLFLLSPAEIILFLLLLFFIKVKYPVILFVYLLYMLMMFIKRSSTTESNIYTFINVRILNEFYEIHLPVLLLIYFSCYESFFITLLLFNLLLFAPIYISYAKGFIDKYAG